MVFTINGAITQAQALAPAQAPAQAPADTKKVSIPDVVVVDGVNYEVTRVDDNAFKKNNKITTITLGKNITEVGANAFAGCKKLKTVKIKVPFRNNGSDYL